MSAGAMLRAVARMEDIARIAPDLSQPGALLGPYRIVRRIGAGAMGVVYEAEDPQLSRGVALKVLAPSRTEEEERRRRFLREARVSAAVVHPNVAAIYGVGHERGLDYLAMEYIAGITLREAIRQRGGPFEIADAIRIGEAIANGVGRSHELGIVHRDLKPENVMITDAGAVKVLDFGLAKLLALPTSATREPPRSGQATTCDGHILGTPAYMSPEQAKGRPVDARSDVFAFGVLLYELVTGSRPFRGETPVELFIAIDRDEPPRPSVLNPLVPPALEAIVRRCLCKAPRDRFASCREVADALRRVSLSEDLTLETLTAGAELPPAGARGEAIDFTAERQRHRQLLGRAELLARLDQVLVADSADHWVVVTGGPGMGKSALLAAWLARREAVGGAVPHHFIRRGEYDWDDPSKLVGSLVAQIGARFPAQREPDADRRMHPVARLAATLRRVSERELVPHGERLVVLIDGLDEYDPPPGVPVGDPLAAFLPHGLPRGVSLVCASQPRHPCVSSLEARADALVRIDLDDPSSAADNDATVRRFWEQAAPLLGLDVRFTDAAIASAGGNMQHAVTLQKHLAGLPAPQRCIEDLPRGLAALLARTWERLALDPIVAGGLGILCVAREAITLDELGAASGWTDGAQRRAFLRDAKELLLEARRPDGNAEYRLHHDSIRSYIAGELGAAALREHHAAMARRLATWPPPRAAAARRYALRHALSHRVEAGEWAAAWRLAADMSFVEARCRELGAHAAETDVVRAAERCRASGDPALRACFDDLARALGRQSHWLRVAPEATAALVWNQLRRSGWSAEELDRQLQVPAAARFLRVQHIATRESLALVRTLAGHSSGVRACAVAPDCRRAVSASADQTLVVWNLDSGRPLATLRGHSDRVHACAVTPDGRRVISASEDHTLKVWDLDTGHLLVSLPGHFARVNACVVTPDGRRIISASEDQTLKVWDPDGKRALATLRGHSNWVNACAVTPDGRRVISASEDQTLKVWDLESGRVLATLQGHAASVRACAVTPDGRRVVSASEDQTLRIWDLESGLTLTILQGHSDWVNACAVTPDGRCVVSASDDNTLKVWDPDSGHLLATLQGHAASVRACAVTQDGRRVISASTDKMLKVWELDSGPAHPVLQGHAARVHACAVTSNGRRAVSSSEDRTLKVWDLDSGRIITTLQGHTATVRACAVTPDGQRAISASDDHTLKVWDLDSGRALATLRGHSDWVSACAVTPDGRRVISGSDDKTVQVWDLDSGRPLASLRGHSDWVRACAVTPDGRRVVSADRTLKVWDLDSGRLLATLSGHVASVRACAVTPDGRRVVSASDDYTLKVWDLDSGHLLATLQGHSACVRACAVTPDGRVVSVSADHTLKVWDLDSLACVLTSYVNAAYSGVAVTGSAVIAGDVTGAVWFLSWPPSA